MLHLPASNSWQISGVKSDLFVNCSTIGLQPLTDWKSEIFLFNILIYTNQFNLKQSNFINHHKPSPLLHLARFIAYL